MIANLGKFVRNGAVALALAGLLTAPVSAQFGRLIPRDVQNVTSDATADDGCKQEKKKSSAASRVLGGILGRTARKAASDSGVSRWVPSSEFSDQLSESIACRLDPEEQKLAADATLRATRSIGGEDEEVSDEEYTGPPVGSTASWKSNTRDNVSGRSTVVGRDNNQGAMDCITVTDVIIVEGEETTANKRMCRTPPSRRYAIAA